ncbi:MAG: tetratricopeptide repeat protein, partial [Candidatus Omnitrophica bacterium]|nr:tetratricopeptide repeat protein [Candidatus Omnitrophota bacterium]
AAPPAQLAIVERDLKTVLSKYPDTNIARLAHIALLEFYITNKKFKEAIDLANTTAKTYSEDRDILSTIQFLKGTIYEKEERWDKALEEFKVLEEKYPNTKLGMQIPIYIGKYYESKGLDREAKGAYQDAAAFYTKMEKEYSGKMLGYTASILLIQTYLSLNDYESAGRLLEKTLHKYVSGMSFGQLLPQVDNIYVKNLNKPEKAIEIYNYMISQTKSSRIKKFLNKKIEALKTAS